MSEVRVPHAFVGAAAAAPDGVTGGPMVAELDADEVVVFMIGMRFNRLRRVRSWWPVFVGMPRMLREIAAEPEIGMLGARGYLSGRTLMVVQYWRSMADLGAYARDPGRSHRPAWAAFYRDAAASADVGIWHETFRVDAGDVKTLYGNMPPFGLGAATRSVPRVSRRRPRAADAMGQEEVALVPDRR